MAGKINIPWQAEKRKGQRLGFTKLKISSMTFALSIISVERFN